ncbi:MBL fold metallo-hydrolase [Herpetosiphon llansteffanensis]|uniref:MBL fold metallo-hydrolase n=1 Tax=Herpetosiphon llansteffanensis TaxID=2094568 RepID=UPI0013DF8BD7|nr:MBL fold metallo-hydrolase [Herpetosiphon llansteffanensis]
MFEPITADLYRIPIPVPLPLKYVNCYLLRADHGWVVIDTGMRYGQAEQTWLETFERLGIEWSQIKQIIVTHYHPDHYGMAGWMAERSGASVWMSPTEIQSVQRAWFQPLPDAADRLADFFELHGMPNDLNRQIWQHTMDASQYVDPKPVLHPLAMDQPLQLGQRSWQLLHAPGHADGQLCLYDAADQLLIVADHVLADITPNISLWPEAKRDPLADYLASLEQFAALDVRLALAGHRKPIVAFRERCHEIAQHHNQRLDLMHDYASTGKTAFEVCEFAFGVSTLSAHQLRFAITETLAHLVYLEGQGRLRREQRARQIIFLDQH